MSEAQKKFYLTTPIYYVNARPHIGHAYTTIAADVIARRHRLLGDDTFFLTGTDEHGQKIERSATAAGIPPQQFADQVSARFESLWKRMGITNDDYIRTTEERHKKGAQKLFDELFQQGFIYLDSYTGAYCVSDETFVDVKPGEPCPDCGRITETVTEENFFFKLSSFQRPLLDLIESNTLKIENESRRNEVLSFLLGPVSKLKEEGFVSIPQMSATARDLNKSSVISEYVKVDELSYTTKGTPYVAGALNNLSVSRSSFTWGIPVPESAAKVASQNHVIYVWLDALANYMTAIGYGSDTPQDKANFEKFWPADLHLVGKEIIRFHCIYWPAFLLALNPKLKLPNATEKQDKHLFAKLSDLTTVPLETHQTWADKWLPKAIVAHGWLLFEESKMSKSRGNIVRTETILDAFGEHYRKELVKQNLLEPTKSKQDLFASDVIRYFLLREIPFGQDGSFSFDALVTRYNADLANGYGNLVSRTLSLIEKSHGSVIRKTEEEDPSSFRSDVSKSTGLFVTFFENGDYSRALVNLWNAIDQADTYISSNAPWKLAKSLAPEDAITLRTVLYNVTSLIELITALLYPILPYATAKVWAQLGLGSIEEAASKGELKDLQWGDLKPGTKLGERSTLFPSIKKEDIPGIIQMMTDMEQNNAAARPAESAGLPHVNNSVDDPTHEHTEFRESPISSVSATPAMNLIAETTHPIADAPAAAETPQIAIDDFVKIDLRVARILVAERIPKADKLLRLEVDLGYERRQILSGIAEWYTPEELIGRNIVVIANLAPRKMRGLESHGMLLAASHGENGKPVLATFGEDIALGSRLK